MNPLTPALSPEAGERENRWQSQCKLSLSPVPFYGGEGWGEGVHSVAVSRCSQVGS